LEVATIEAFVRDRAFAWIDDELDERDTKRMQRSRAPATLLVRIDPPRASKNAHVDTLRDVPNTRVLLRGSQPRGDQRGLGANDSMVKHRHSPRS